MLPNLFRLPQGMPFAQRQHSRSRRRYAKSQVQNGPEQVLYAFQGGADGGTPIGPLIFDSSGNLYGTTQYGRLRRLAFLCLLSFAITWSACGGSSGSTGGGGTTAGTYNLTVTGTFTSGSTALNHTTKLTLVVQ